MIEISMAVVVHQGKILIAQRKKGKHQEFMWEFPGGKLEKGETLQECVAREFMEEFEKEITVGDFFMDKTFHYADKGDFHLNAFWATCADDTILNLYEHEDVKWVSPAEMDNYTFCPADLPFIEGIKQHFKIK
ncbi:MAG: (deoxy)nucleoside triphosphate pyrophosphohydrolase [Alphaproteobacteria bacterium]|nr:(deoxy)nucleoside triphosphate pyrophosphohydrolase [Alphaproteobacteria bacterium]